MNENFKQMLSCALVVIKLVYSPIDHVNES